MKKAYFFLLTKYSTIRFCLCFSSLVPGYRTTCFWRNANTTSVLNPVDFCIIFYLLSSLSLFLEEHCQFYIRVWLFFGNKSLLLYVFQICVFFLPHWFVQLGDFCRNYFYYIIEKNLRLYSYCRFCNGHSLRTPLFSIFPYVEGYLNYLLLFSLLQFSISD